LLNMGDNSSEYKDRGGVIYEAVWSLRAILSHGGWWWRWAGHACCVPMPSCSRDGGSRGGRGHHPHPQTASCNVTYPGKARPPHSRQLMTHRCKGPAASDVRLHTHPCPPPFACPHPSSTTPLSWQSTTLSDLVFSGSVAQYLQSACRMEAIQARCQVPAHRQVPAHTSRARCVLG
jgi:hypothetical protein